MGEFDLDDAQLNDIFSGQVMGSVPLHAPEDEPTIVLVAAQPGAGKTRTLEQVRQSHDGAYAVEGDALRRFHPGYAGLMRREPLRMPDATAQAAGRWVEMTLALMREYKNSVMLETTMRHPQAVERTLGEFRQAGYRTEAIIVATPSELSLMGTMARYISQAEQQGEGRWVDPAAHDEAVAQMPRTLAEQISRGNIDHVSVTNRAGERLYDADINTQNRDETIAAASKAISQGQRFESITPDQQQQWDRDVKHVRAFISAHPESQDVRSLADRIIASGQSAIQSRQVDDLIGLTHTTSINDGIDYGRSPTRKPNIQHQHNKDTEIER
jgi:hypothetical protein